MDIVDKFIAWVRPILGDFGCLYIGIGLLAVVGVVAVIDYLRG